MFAVHLCCQASAPPAGGASHPALSYLADHIEPGVELQI
jgi:hypothetical protein